MKLYLVLNPKALEGVVLPEQKDALYASDGNARQFGVSSLASEFRDVYGDDPYGDDDDQGGEIFPMIEIELTAAQCRALKLDTAVPNTPARK